MAAVPVEMAASGTAPKAVHPLDDGRGYIVAARIRRDDLEGRITSETAGEYVGEGIEIETTDDLGELSRQSLSLQQDDGHGLEQASWKILPQMTIAG